MKNNRLRLGIALIIILYGGFLTYFCMAKPCEPNNIVIEQEKTIGQNTGKARIVGSEFYLYEITNFYKLIITLLFGVIAFLLVFSFIYVHLTSKIQAEDMASEALNTKSFQTNLENTINQKFAGLKNEDEFAEMYSAVPDLQNRLSFLEQQASLRSYEELGDEESGKVN